MTVPTITLELRTLPAGSPTSVYKDQRRGVHHPHIRPSKRTDSPTVLWCVVIQHQERESFSAFRSESGARQWLDAVNTIDWHGPA